MICPTCNRPILAEGTHPGTEANPLAIILPLAPANDFADHIKPGDAHGIELATARAEAALTVLRALIHAFQRELAGSFTTYEQQAALGRARALIVEAERNR